MLGFTRYYDIFCYFAVITVYREFVTILDIKISLSISLYRGSNVPPYPLTRMFLINSFLDSSKMRKITMIIILKENSQRS